MAYQAGRKLKQLIINELRESVAKEKDRQHKTCARDNKILFKNYNF